MRPEFSDVQIGVVNGSPPLFFPILGPDRFPSREKGDPQMISVPKGSVSFSEVIDSFVCRRCGPPLLLIVKP